MIIREERLEDRRAVWTVERDAFGRPVEADLVDKLRVADAVLSLVAEDPSGGIVGHILFTRLALEEVRAVALAPMAVSPRAQRSGIGSALVSQGLATLRERGEQAVFVLGHREFYPRFGFRNDLAAQFESPYAGDHFFALELEPGALAGRAGPVRFASAFE